MFSEREMYPRRVKMAWSREVCEPSGNEPTASSTLDAVATHEKNDEGGGGGGGGENEDRTADLPPTT